MNRVRATTLGSMQLLVVNVARFFGRKYFFEPLLDKQCRSRQLIRSLLQ